MKQEEQIEKNTNGTNESAAKEDGMTGAKIRLLDGSMEELSGEVH